MYQIHSDIFTKIALYVKIARQFKEDIKEINVSNEIEEFFGKLYCRVYVNIKLKEGSPNEFEVQEALWNDFSRFREKQYFSFYLIHGWRDNEYLLRNIEEQTHYDYIWNLLTWYLKDDGIRVEAARFKNQNRLMREEEEQHKKYEQHRKLVHEAVDKLVPEIGQFIAIKQLSSSQVRVGRVENLKLTNRKERFSADIVELKMDLTPGKLKINLWNLAEIYALMQPQNLPKGINKSKLIGSIERGEHFEGLIWRRPQELW